MGLLDDHVSRMESRKSHKICVSYFRFIIYFTAKYLKA